MSDKLKDPQKAVESMGENVDEMGEMGENFDTDLDKSTSGQIDIWPGPLGNTDPDTDIDDIEGFRLGKEYIGKYLQRGINKLMNSGMTAGMDISLALLSMIYHIFTQNESDTSKDEKQEDAENIVSDKGEV